MNNLRKKPADCVYWSAAALLLLPWVIIQSQMSANSDVAWLSICAERLLHGGTLTNSCYDTNPPLSVLIYAPFIWLSKITTIPNYHLIFWLTLGSITFATAATHKLSGNKILAIAFLSAITILPSLYYAERDHFIAIFLLPFILTQFKITQKEPIPNFWKYAALILGSIAILIKPHFSLIPALMFLYRLKQQKSLSLIKDPDFIILTLSSLFYLLSIFLFYNDFITVILPDIIDFYLGYNNPGAVITKLKLYAPLFIIFTASLIIFKKEKDCLTKTLLTCAGLCLLIFTIQMKGFTYHLLPFFALFFPVVFANIPKTHPAAALIGLFTFAYIFSPLRPEYPTHEDYKKNEITAYLDKHCTQPCSYLMLHENMDITSQIAYYSGHTYATRFPAFWFQPRLTETAKPRFANLIAQDIQTYSPSLIFIPKNSNFLDFYAASSEFVQTLSTYKKTDQLTVDRAFFYKNTKYDFPHSLTWNVYTK